MLQLKTIFKVKNFFSNICECGDFIQLSKKESIKIYNHEFQIIKFYGTRNLFVHWILFFMRLSNMSAVGEKYFMSIFFPSLLAIQSGCRTGHMV